MSIGHSDLLGYAASLVADTKLAEVGCRTAICRAYYAAFHESQDWYDKLPAPGSFGTKTPKGLHDRFFILLSNPHSSVAAPQASASRRRAYALRMLHDTRTKADYELSASVTLDDANQAIEDAKTIIATT